MPRGAPHARSCGQRVPGTASEIMQTRMNPTGQKPFPPRQGSPRVLRSEEPLMEEGRKRMPPVPVHRGPRKRRHGLREGAVPRAGRKRRQARHSPQLAPAATRLRATTSLPQLLRGARRPGGEFQVAPPSRAWLFLSCGVSGFCGQGTGFERATQEHGRVREAFTPLFLKCAGCPGISGVTPAGRYRAGSARQRKHHRGGRLPHPRQPAPLLPER